MGESTTTHRAYHFAAKAGASEYWIALEPLSEGDLPCLQRGFMGFSLKPGTSQAEAVRIADFLNAHIASLSYTA